jgi:chaperonin GroEL
LKTFEATEMQPKPVRDITLADELDAKIAAGVEKIYQVAKASYGPKAGNTLIQLSAGAPLLSRDGVTNVSRVELDDPVENMAAQVVKQASKQSNEHSGDGTSAVVILTYHLYKQARKLVSAGHNRMAVARMLEESMRLAVAHIDSLSEESTSEILAHVATISAGDEAIGQLISETINEVGVDGGITVEDYSGIGIHNEIVDGFYFRKGFNDIRLVNDYTNLKATYENVAILLSENRLSTVTEIAPIIEKILEKGIKQLVIIGEVADDAQNVLLLSKAKGVIDVTVVEPPAFAGGRTLFLEDIAVLTGGQLLVSKPSDFNVESLGYAEKVVITEFSTTIIGADGSEEDKEKRITDIREQIANESNPHSLAAMKDRLAKMTGKIAIVRVGGATEIEQGEAKLRVQDAVCAVQAAAINGVVPGGGVTLATMKGTKFDNAYKQPFRQLMDNAGLNPEFYLFQLKNPWFGFNLKNITDEPVDLLKEGIIDPTQVIKEVVQNATSVAVSLITTSAAISYKKE